MDKHLEIKRLIATFLIFTGLIYIFFLANKFIFKLTSLKAILQLSKIKLGIFLLITIAIIISFITLIIYIVVVYKKYKFKRENGEVIKAWITEKIKDPTNKFTKTVICYTYHLKIEYKNKEDILDTFDCKVPKELYSRLRIQKTVPLKLYKDHIVIDEKRIVH